MSFPTDAPLLECVPNFSEGRDRQVIDAIAAAIEAVPGALLLDVDPGRSTNRTVMTFAGPPEAVVEAAYRGIAEAVARIDMRRHRGTHPRLGAADVCPLVPLARLGLDEAADHARRLGERVGRELDVPVYLYGHAAASPRRRRLPDVRRGGYEGLADKLRRPGGRPDFGPAELRPRSGATIIGARDLLVAYNVNLDSDSAAQAAAIAGDVRESGRLVCDNAGLSRPGRKVRRPGTLPGVRAIGWYIEEYGRAQVSLNVTDLSATPLHLAFEEVAAKARERGLRVTGSELVGLVPLPAMLAAGRHFLARERTATGASESDLVNAAVRGLGLDEQAPFDPRRKILEYRLENL